MVTDFEYDGILLSQVGYAIVSFGGIRDGEIDTDSQISFNHSSMMQGKYQPFSSYIYDDVLKMELYIGKDMCRVESTQDGFNYNISVSEMAFLKRWLSRPTPHILRAIGDDSYNGIFWRGSFVVEEYTLGDGRIGAHLTFECDAPFGYMEDVLFRDSLTSGSSYKYNCISDEIGYIYPNLSILLKESGNLELTNAHDNRKTIVKNCEADEIITFTDKLQVFSSISSHKILDDFNYVFYRINNSFKNVENTISSNLAIDFVINYNPYAKAVIV